LNFLDKTMAERYLTFKDTTVLSMYVDGQEDSYRIQVDDSFRCVSSKPKVYKYSDILCFLPLLIDNLPPPHPPGDWTTMTVGGDDCGSLTRSIFYKPLVSVASEPDSCHGAKPR
jgi:hypothetical protein